MSHDESSRIPSIDPLSRRNAWSDLSSSGTVFELSTLMRSIQVTYNISQIDPIYLPPIAGLQLIAQNGKDQIMKM